MDSNIEVKLLVSEDTRTRHELESAHSVDVVTTTTIGQRHVLMLEQK